MAEQNASLDDMIDNADALTLNAAGNSFADRGMWNEAVACYERSRDRYRQEGDRRGEALALNNLGAAAYATGDWDAALDYYEQALAILRSLGEHESELMALMNICFLHYAQGGNPDDELDRAQALAETLGKDDPLAKIYWMRGDAAFRDGKDLPAAFDAYALACVHASQIEGDLLERTLGYVDEHLRVLVHDGQTLAALAFCDHLLEVGRANRLSESFQQQMTAKRAGLMSPPLLGTA